MLTTKEAYERSIKAIFGDLDERSSKPKTNSAALLADQRIKEVLGNLGRLEAWGDSTATKATIDDFVNAATTALEQFCNGNVLQAAIANLIATGPASSKTIAQSDDVTRWVPKFHERLVWDVRAFRAALTALATDNTVATTAVAHKWKWSAVVIAKRLGVPLTSVITTAPVGQPVKLTGGRMTTTWLVDFGGNIGRRVFKRNEVTQYNADVTGNFLDAHFDRDMAHTVIRALSASRVDKAIRSKIAGPQQAEYPLLLGEVGLAVFQGELGTAVQFFDGFALVNDVHLETAAPGNNYQVALNVDLNPVVLRKLTNLVTLDKITGEQDRHLGNVMVHSDTNGVVGIDNDFSFTGLDVGDFSRQRIPLPLLFDAVFGAAVTALTDADIDAACLGLQPQEIRLTKARLDFIKKQITTKPKIGLPGSTEAKKWDTVNVKTDFGPAKSVHYVVDISEIAETAKNAKKTRKDIVDFKGKKCLLYDASVHGSFYIQARKADASDLLPFVGVTSVIGQRGAH